ncbi:MAG: Gar1/Naf1 family protein [Candidatus Hydrothermarchaeales archaeon]
MAPLRFSHITNAGNIVLRGDEIPSMYSLVAIKDSRIGKIQDIIGPVSRPYILVKPDKKLTKDDVPLLRKEIFHELKGRRARGGKKGRVHRRLSRVWKQKP